MSFIGEIIKKVSPFMKSKGFTRSGRSFCYISENIAYCLDISMPTGLVYVTTYVMPLYIPCECKYLSYGNRLNTIRGIELPLLSKESEETTIDAWCQSLCCIIDKKVLPFFEKIGSPETLLAYLVKYQSDLLTSYLACDTVSFWRLKMFTELFMGELSEVVGTMSRYRGILNEATFLSSRIIQKHLDETYVVETLIHNEEATKEFFLGVETNVRQFLK